MRGIWSFMLLFCLGAGMVSLSGCNASQMSTDDAMNQEGAAEEEGEGDDEAEEGEGQEGQDGV